MKSAVLLLAVFQAMLGSRTAGGNVQNLPPADRCAIARWLSHYIVKATDFANRTSYFSNGMRLFISADCRPGSFGFPGESHANVSLFRKGETCEDLQVHRLDASAPMINVTLATGNRDDLPADEVYVFVRTFSLGSRHWEFVWEWNDALWSCPPGEKVRMCGGPLKWGEGVQPSLIVRMAKTRGGEIEVESSALEFRRQVGRACKMGP